MLFKEALTKLLLLLVRKAARRDQVGFGNSIIEMERLTWNKGSEESCEPAALVDLVCVECHRHFVGLGNVVGVTNCVAAYAALTVFHVNLDEVFVATLV